jgi:hypothetical protein
MINKRLILALLILAIIAVIMRDFFDIHQCINTGGKWNPKTKVCELELPKKK